MAEPRRLQRLEKELLRILNNTLVFKINDDRLQWVSITGVSLSPDLQFARIFFSSLEQKVNVPKITAILTNASGFMKKEIAEAHFLRRIPELTFVYDDSSVKGRSIESLLKDIKKEQETSDIIDKEEDE